MAVAWLWTWEGACFGYRDGDGLWTPDGRHAGRFVGDREVYAPSGAYLGELRDGRLIADAGKLDCREPAFSPEPRTPARAPRLMHASRVLPAGYRSFPAPDGREA